MTCQHRCSARWSAPSMQGGSARESDTCHTPSCAKSRTHFARTRPVVGGTATSVSHGPDTPHTRRGEGFEPSSEENPPKRFSSTPRALEIADVYWGFGLRDVRGVGNGVARTATRAAAPLFPSCLSPGRARRGSSSDSPSPERLHRIAPRAARRGSPGRSDRRPRATVRARYPLGRGA